MEGPSTTSPHFDRQVAKVQIRAAVLNRFPALGIPMTQAAGKCPEKGEVRSSVDLRDSASASLEQLLQPVFLDRMRRVGKVTPDRPRIIQRTFRIEKVSAGIHRAQLAHKNLRRDRDLGKAIIGGNWLLNP